MWNDDSARNSKTKDPGGNILTTIYSFQILFNDVSGHENEAAIRKLLHRERELLLRKAEKFPLYSPENIGYLLFFSLIYGVIVFGLILYRSCFSKA